MHNSSRDYEACVLVNGKPVTEVLHGGHIYIEGRKNSTYELYFKNNTNRRVMVIPSVDGLNTIDGKSCGVDSSGYVIPAYGNITIPGWEVDGSTNARFTFKSQGAYSSHEKTYSEAVGESEENQGVLGFMVFPEQQQHRFDMILCSASPSNRVRDRLKRRSMVSDSHSVQTSYTSSDGSASNVSCSVDTLGNQTANAGFDVVCDQEKSLGTGFGKPVTFETTQVEFERENDTTPDAVFAIYYDTLRNLKKLGVPVERFGRHYSESYGPNPFPESPEVTGAGCKTPPGWDRRHKRGKR